MNKVIQKKNKRKKMRELFKLQQGIRNYFTEEGFTDVLTPPIVQNPGMEVHIHPFQVFSKINNSKQGLYLHTSPEFHMKQLLSEGMEKIFTLSYCFRDEPSSSTHRAQFVMLEWYRAHERYESIMDDCEELLNYCNAYLIENDVKTKFEAIEMTKKTCREIFRELLDVDLYDLLDITAIYNYIQNSHSDIHLNSIDKYSWDDLYFLLFLNKVEPKLVEINFLLLYEFPHQLKALSTIKETDPNVCERFEIYANGIEICNCFNELVDIEEQRKRFSRQAKIKKDLYGYELPSPEVLYEALRNGVPPSAGIALGVERLLMSLIKTKDPFFN